MNLKGSENVQAGAQVYCWASSINSGARHYHKIRVVGSKASLEWDDERPNQMLYEVEGEPSRVLERGAGYLTDEGACRGSYRRRPMPRVCSSVEQPVCTFRSRYG